MTTVAAILKHKDHALGPHTVASVPPQTSIAEVTRRLTEHRIGAVLVRDNDQRILGILSERDIVRSLAEHGAGALDMHASDLMTRSLRTATPETTVAEAMAMMTAGRFRHIPVLEGDRLIGLVSIGDVVKSRIMEQESEVDSLKAYVAGMG